MNGTSSPICPCGTVVHPTVIFNPPERNAIAYRCGQYADFRYALLQALPGETELSETVGTELTQIWQPTASGDLALQMVEWFAYLADVLTFYNERIATQAYLRTADLPESPGLLIALLGYRPRPALGSVGTLAALLSGAGPYTLPAGMPIQSKPGPGNQPQTFELQSATTIAQPDVTLAEAVPLTTSPFGIDPKNGYLIAWLSGNVSGIKQNDELLLSNAGSFAWCTVASVAPQQDPVGNPITQITFSSSTFSSSSTASVSTLQLASDWQVLRSTQSMPLWPFGGAGPFAGTGVDLAGVARSIQPNDFVLLDVAVTSPPTATPPLQTSLYTVAQYSEVIGFAAVLSSSPPQSMPVAHTHLNLAADNFTGFCNQWNSASGSITARFAFTPVGTLVQYLQATDVELGSDTTALEAVAVSGFAINPYASGSVLLEGANDAGAQADATVSSNGTQTLLLTNLAIAAAPTPPLTNLTTAGTAPTLTAPIDVYFNLLPVSQGKTVSNEMLGTGNSLIAGQDFTLQKSPVTYFADEAALSPPLTPSLSGTGFSSTVHVWVDNIEWTEVPSFFGQSAQAQIFVTNEDAAGNTHVTFGDGTNGARLPTGANVVATYRYSAGVDASADAPDPGTLTVVLQPQPGLKAIANPIAPTLGAPADSSAEIKTLAPASVMTFGRAVSLDDYRAIALGVPGVTQVQVQLAFDAQRQRPWVTLWFAPTTVTVANVASAFTGVADPNALPSVNQAISVSATLSFTFVCNPNYPDATVQAALQTALVDPNAGLFGSNVVGIGQAFYKSQIYKACVAVPGVEAIESLSFEFERAPGSSHTGQRFDPGPGNYFSVSLSQPSGVAPT